MTKEEAIKKVREAMPTLWKETKEAIQTLIPELAESEDDRIIRAIIDALYSHTNSINLLSLRGYKIEDIKDYLETQKKQKPIIFIPKFRTGDKVLSTKNPHLTYDILEVGLINELGNPDYRVEIFIDGKPGMPEYKKEHNIQLIECQKMDSWGELIEQKPVEQIENNEEESIGTTLINALNGNARLEWELKRAGIDVKRLITYLEQKEQKSLEYIKRNSKELYTLLSEQYDKGYRNGKVEQKPVKWSEEDERIRGHIIDVLTYYAENHSALTVAFIKRDIDWLKSLPMGCPKKLNNYDTEK